MGSLVDATGKVLPLAWPCTGAGIQRCPLLLCWQGRLSVNVAFFIQEGGVSSRGVVFKEVLKEVTVVVPRLWC
jgi:hypothetical protein